MNPAYVAALLAALLLAPAACRRPQPPPTLATAAVVRGRAGERARAYLAVALSGRASERRRAALLWGLFACEVPSPRAATRAFSLAGPEGGAALLAARRLEEALGRDGIDPLAWSDAAAAPFVHERARARFLLRAAEEHLAAGDEDAALAVLPVLESLSEGERGTALAVRARCRNGGETARRRLATAYPATFAATFPGDGLEEVRRTFTAADWAEHAGSLLASGEAEAALRAARRAGTSAALTAARAALALRRPREALAWAERAGRGNTAAALEQAEALRQLAWMGPAEARGAGFARVAGAAEKARRLAGGDDAGKRRADLMLAEALTERGQLADAATVVARSFDRSQPRWEWVWRRLQLAAWRRGKAAPPEGTDPPVSTRSRRTAAYLRATDGGTPDLAALHELADSGFPDLPALWAATALNRPPASVVLADGPLPAADQPGWAADLLTAGRVADVVAGWRLELEQTNEPGSPWLGLVRLAEMPPLDAVPLLLRGEPRLLSGPWSGLPRELLERYLPLPWRDELEGAARRAAVPPWLLAGLVRHESAWNPYARSSAGALGLAQLVPATAHEKARALRLGRASRADLTEPEINLTIGAALLADWRRAFAGSWTAALAAYNGGERRAREVWERGGRDDGAAFVEALEVPETHDYVHRVVLLAEGYRLLYWPEGRPYPWT